MKFYRDSPMMGPSFSFIYIFGDQVINSPFLMVKCQFDVSIRILVGQPPINYWQTFLLLVKSTCLLMKYDKVTIFAGEPHF